MAGASTRAGGPASAWAGLPGQGPGNGTWQRTAAPSAPSGTASAGPRGGHCPPVLPLSPRPVTPRQTLVSCVRRQAAAPGSSGLRPPGGSGTLPPTPGFGQPGHGCPRGSGIRSSGLGHGVLKSPSQGLVPSVFSGVVPLWESQLYSRKPEQASCLHILILFKSE